jgi:hypothetical protein
MPAELRRIARANWAADRPDAALAAAWAAYEQQPNDRDGWALLARLLLQYPDRITLERRSALLELLQHPQIDPDQVSPAGWRLVRRAYDGFTQACDGGDLRALAARLAGDDLILTLLLEHGDDLEWTWQGAPQRWIVDQEYLAKGRAAIKAAERLPDVGAITGVRVMSPKVVAL